MYWQEEKGRGSIYIYIYSCGRTPNVLYHNLKYNYIAAQPLPPIIFPELVKNIIYSLILDMNNQKIIKKGLKTDKILIILYFLIKFFYFLYV